MTPAEAAHWMIGQFRIRQMLDHDQVITHLARDANKALLVLNARHNLALSPAVLTAFRNLSGPAVV